jgi:hypothetical protein
MVNRSKTAELIRNGVCARSKILIWSAKSLLMLKRIKNLIRPERCNKLIRGDLPALKAWVHEEWALFL